ncbi:MAG: hypothetical protein C0601_05985 [Candidatus Muiribacterium halophilum]|uniref:Anti-sigma factor antagonist n=1 Tax=Muiribacterium halophilum TaxID=2053465 RepID=A0A2N5ZH02_MUIH1|nr:MAG: hypothetical protein C0601_05985 [Candidatus Muirbacterium halophilum]
MNSLNIKIATLNNVVIIKFIGHAGADRAEDLKEIFEKSISKGRNHFLIELSQCSYMDSTFIGMLLFMNKTAINHRGNMVLLNTQEEIKTIFKNMGLHTFFIMETSENFKKLHNLSDVKHKDHPKKEQLKDMLMAHEAIIASSPKQQSKFQNLIDFLKKEIEE